MLKVFIDPVAGKRDEYLVRRPERLRSMIARNNE